MQERKKHCGKKGKSRRRIKSTNHGRVNRPVVPILIKGYNISNRLLLTKDIQ
jgi:hypothetical protein